MFPQAADVLVDDAVANRHGLTSRLRCPLCGGGILVLVGVLRVTGIEPDQGEESAMSVIINRGGLDQMIRNAEEIDGKHQVKLVDLMNPAFISTHSKFTDFDALLAASGFKVDSAEDFAAIPDDEWDDYIKSNTDFENWLEMQKTAGAEYMRSKLFSGL